VRIDMPNKHIVYMHDTPLKKLFNYHMRPYSAGCVRVQKALDLATWLLSYDDPEWNRARVDSMIASELQETVDLKKRIPVHFVYVTAWATELGEIAFREDIYGRDGSRALVASAGNWNNTREIAP
jgi:murein L,D-transpeptidase YcbB/YkuD